MQVCSQRRAAPDAPDDTLSGVTLTLIRRLYCRFRSSSGLGFGLLFPALLLGCRHSSLPDVPAGYQEFAYVANSGSNTVSVLDLVYFRPERTLQVGNTPVALAVNPRLNEVYVLNSQPRAGAGSGAGSLSVIDTGRNQVVATIALGRNPTALAVDPMGRRAYAVNTAGDSVSVVDLDKRSVIATVATAAAPSGVRVAPDDRTLVVSNAGSGSVMLFSIAATGAPLTLRTTIPGCPGAVSPVVLPDSSKTLVACAGGHQVLAISLAAEPGGWNARQDATLLSDHLLAVLDVGPNPSNLTMKPDGGEVFASDGPANSISEIATNTNEVGNTQPIGSRPGRGIVSADGSSLWIANSGADSISLYSIDDGKLLASLRTGDQPAALAFSAEENLVLAADRGSGDVALILTKGRQGPPALFTMMPAGSAPVAIVVKAMHDRP